MNAASRLSSAGLFAIALVASAVGPARGDDHCCACCGSNAACKTICRLVFEEKKVPVTCWGSLREDFCVPGPSKPGCKQWDTVCDERACSCSNGVAAVPQRFVWREWTPWASATVFTRNKLMKRTVTKSVPSYKWQVEYLCEDCYARCFAVTVEPGATAPPPPPVDALPKRPGVDPR